MGVPTLAEEGGSGGGGGTAAESSDGYQYFSAVPTMFTTAADV